MQRVGGANSSHTVFLFDLSNQDLRQLRSSSLQYSPSTSCIPAGHAPLGATAAGAGAGAAGAPLVAGAAASDVLGIEVPGSGVGAGAGAAAVAGSACCAAQAANGKVTTAVQSAARAKRTRSMRVTRPCLPRDAPRRALG